MNKIIKNASAVKKRILDNRFKYSHRLIISITGGLYIKQLEQFFLLIDQCLNDTEFIRKHISIMLQYRKQNPYRSIPQKVQAIYLTVIIQYSTAQTI